MHVKCVKINRCRQLVLDGVVDIRMWIIHQMMRVKVLHTTYCFLSSLTYYFKL